MKIIEDTSGHSCTVPDLRVRYLVVESTKARYEIAEYPDARAGMRWGEIWSLTTHRKISHSSKVGQAVLAAARVHVAKAVAA
ncbi:hypothetical protein [Corynebacterium sp. AOP12-C2-36]|uniref:hypothetical protein n=1 Tax=Corynebacterium sp. AOP12-C2-36 TaxID=3457723 RepID=UPI0040335585